MAADGGSRRRFLLLSPLFLLFLRLSLFVLLFLFLTGQGLLPMTGRTVAAGGGGGKLGRAEGGRWFFFSVFSSPPVFVLLLLSLLLLFLMVAAVVGGAMVVLFCDGGSVGGGWEERWRRWWRCNGALLLPLLSCSFTLLSPFSSFFFCFARAPLLSNKLPPSVFYSSLLQNFSPLGFLFFLFLHPLSSLSVTALYL